MEVEGMKMGKYLTGLVMTVCICILCWHGATAEPFLLDFMNPTIKSGFRTTETSDCTYFHEPMGPGVSDILSFRDVYSWSIHYGRNDVEPSITIITRVDVNLPVIEKMGVGDVEADGFEQRPESFVLEQATVSSALCLAENNNDFEVELFRYSTLEY